MDSILVKGGGALNGQIPIAGAKNACLALMPATLLSEEPLTLTNAPRLSDVRTMTASGIPNGLNSIGVIGVNTEFRTEFFCQREFLFSQVDGNNFAATRRL